MQDKWLRSVFGEHAITDKLKLLADCRQNAHVYNFIGFIFTSLNHFWACRFATQCSDSNLMDFAWKYALLVFNVTNEGRCREGFLYKKAFACWTANHIFATSFGIPVLLTNQIIRVQGPHWTMRLNWCVQLT